MADTEPRTCGNCKHYVPMKRHDFGFCGAPTPFWVVNVAEKQGDWLDLVAPESRAAECELWEPKGGDANVSER